MAKAQKKPSFNNAQCGQLERWGLSTTAIRRLEDALRHVAVARNTPARKNDVRRQLQRVNKPLAATVRALTLLQDRALLANAKSDAFEAFNLLLLERDDRHLVDRLREIAGRFSAIEKRLVEHQIIKVDENAGSIEFGYKVRTVRSQHRNQVNTRPIKRIAAALAPHGPKPSRTGKFAEIVALCFAAAGSETSIRYYLQQQPKTVHRSRGRPPKIV